MSVNADPVLSGSELLGQSQTGGGGGGGVSSMSLREVLVRVNPDDKNLLIPICINGVDTEAVVDTGAQCTVISEALLSLMKQELSFEETVILREAQSNGSKARCSGAVVYWFSSVHLGYLCCSFD